MISTANQLGKTFLKCVPIWDLNQEHADLSQQATIGPESKFFLSHGFSYQIRNVLTHTFRDKSIVLIPLLASIM
jgi:hypothetical protein